MSNYGNYPDLSFVERVLVIKLRNLGDVLLSSPVFTHLKKSLPNAVIDAYITSESLPMLAGHPAISHFHLLDRSKRSLARDARLLWDIRGRGYDLVINLTEGDRGAIAALVSGAEICVGIDPGSSGFPLKRNLYTQLVKPCKTPRHAVERDLDALRRIGLFPAPHERELFYAVPPEAHARAIELVAACGLTPGEFILFHGSSRWRFKAPSKAKIQNIVKALQKQGNTVVLTGGPGEAEEIDGAINLAGKTSLKELGALMQLSKGLITVDSVTLHMASALKVPVVALFGPTSEKNWGPWRHPRAQVVTQALSCRPCLMDGCGGSKHSDCLETLSTESILTAWELLQQQPLPLRFSH